MVYTLESNLNIPLTKLIELYFIGSKLIEKKQIMHD